MEGEGHADPKILWSRTAPAAYVRGRSDVLPPVHTFSNTLLLVHLPCTFRFREIFCERPMCSLVCCSARAYIGLASPRERKPSSVKRLRIPDQLRHSIMTGTLHNTIGWHPHLIDITRTIVHQKLLLWIIGPKCHSVRADKRKFFLGFRFLCFIKKP